MQLHVKTNAKHTFDETLWPGGDTLSKYSPRRLSQKWTISFMKMQNFGNEMAGHHFEEILRVRGEAGRMEDQGRFNILF